MAGGSLEDAADVLGNSPKIIRKHLRCVVRCPTRASVDADELDFRHFNEVLRRYTEKLSPQVTGKTKDILVDGMGLECAPITKPQ